MRAPASQGHGWGHAVASVLAAFLIVAGLCGSTCAVAVCVEDCDPCFNQCKCHTTCHHGLLDTGTAHKLTGYILSVFDDSQGGVVRTISEIVGLSLDLADGPRAHSPADFERFAEGVIEFNGLVLQARGRTWEPGAVVVPFASTGGEARLTFLFDRRGNLIEIDEVRP